MRGQMRRDEIEVPPVDQEALSYASLVADHAPYALRHGCALDLGHVWLVLLLDEADEPHLPHGGEFLVQHDELVLAQVILELFQPVAFVLALALLGADRDHVVVFCVGED